MALRSPSALVAGTGSAAALLVALLAGSTAAVGAPAADAPAGRAPAAPAPAAAALPAVSVQTLASGLTYPWDLDFLPQGQMIYTQRDGATSIRAIGGVGPGRLLRMDQSDLVTGGERGLMGIAVDPAFSTNRTFYTCQTYAGGRGQAADVRVIRWRLAANGGRALRVGTPLVSGITQASTHVGCRLRFAADGTLFVGTGDGQLGTGPQSLGSLNGKVLRVTTAGTAPVGNPFRSSGGTAALVWTRGHRNVQGLAVRPGTSQVWSAEHGPNIDDEINLLQAGANYGWNPVPGYNQNVPMTDTTTFPQARAAAWSSGARTRATSGATFLQGAGWGSAQGALAIGLLKDSGVMILTVDANGTVTGQSDVPELAGTYGRIRTVQTGPDGALYLTTSNGARADRILRVTPTG